MTIPRQSVLEIRTPEGITFTLLLAGPITRFLAWLLDCFCVMTIMSLVEIAVSLLDLLSHDIAWAVYTAAYFAAFIGYGIALEWYWRGQTIGKRLLRLRVMDVQGLKLRFNQIVIRNLLRAVDILPAVYLAGGLSCWLSRRAQRLGDIAANTIVVRNPKTAAPDLTQLHGGPFNSFKSFPHLEARLRRQVSPEEAALALQALLRRDELDPEPRVELFRRIAGHFQSLVAFPPETVEGIPDEQYVRNVVDTVYRARA